MNVQSLLRVACIGSPRLLAGKQLRSRTTILPIIYAQRSNCLLPSRCNARYFHIRSNIKMDHCGRSGWRDSGTEIINPATIQVYADPKLAGTVRDMTADVMEIRMTLDRLSNDIHDCEYELLRLGEDHEEFKATTNDLQASVSLNESKVSLFEAEHSNFGKSILHLSKMAAEKDGQLDKLAICTNALQSVIQLLSLSFDIKTDLTNIKMELHDVKTRLRRLESLPVK